MQKGIEVRLGPGDGERLEAVVADRNSAQKHVWRAQIILATAEGCGTVEVMRRAGVSKPSVWRWQHRFMAAGVEGLLRDKTRKPGKAPVPDPRWTFHFTPTSASWLNAVEGFFAKLTRRRLSRGIFHSLVDLQATINRYLAEHNRSPKPFIWTADPDRIIAAANRGYQALNSIH